MRSADEELNEPTWIDGRLTCNYWQNLKIHPDQQLQPNIPKLGCIPIRKYMKSYLPRLVSSKISLSMAY